MNKKIFSFLFALVAFGLSGIANAQPDTCRVTGTFYLSDGVTPAPGVRVTVRNVILDGHLIILGPTYYISDGNGRVSFLVPAGATMSIEAPVSGFSTRGGVTVSIPSVGSCPVTLESLQQAPPPAVEGMIIKINGSQLTTNLITTIDFSSEFSGTESPTYEANISINSLARSKIASGNAHRILVNNASGVMSEASALTNGQILIGSTGAAPVAASLTAGSNITITPGAGSITIASTGGSGAPIDATYITQTPNGTLNAEQALSVLATGLLKVTTSTGVVSSVTTSADFFALIDDETGSGAIVGGTSPTISSGIFSSPSLTGNIIVSPSGSGDFTFTSDAATELAEFDFQSNFSSNDQLLIEQSVGNPTGGSLVGIRTADADVIVFEATAQGSSNGVRLNASAALAPIGTGTIEANVITDGTIVNADVNASAGIARSKLASGNAHRILVNDASGVMSEASALTNGQILIGSTGAAPVAASLTAGSNITITPGAGSITIASTVSVPVARANTGWTSNGTIATDTLSTYYVLDGNFIQFRIIDADNDSLLFYPGSLYPIRYRDGATDLFRVDSLGNVLVGGDLSVTDLAYDATTWNGSVVVPTRNAIRDKFEGLVLDDISNVDLTGASAGVLLVMRDSGVWVDTTVALYTGWTYSPPNMLFTTNTDNLVIGGTSSLGKMTINGDTNETQLWIQAHSTQTDTLVKISDSSNGALLEVYNGGTFFFSRGNATGYISVPGGSLSEKFGASATATGSEGTALGNDAQSNGPKTVGIGQGVRANNATGLQVIIGEANSGTGHSQTLVGQGITSSANYATFYGQGHAGNFSSTIVGAGGTTTANGQFIGGSTVNAITDVYFGNGIQTQTTGTSYTIHGSPAASGQTNLAGGNLTITAGKGTGSGAGGDIIFQTATPGGSGTSQNAYVERVRVQDSGQFEMHNAVAVSIPSGATGPTEINSTGEIGIETNPLAGALNFYNGSSESSLSPAITKSWCVESPTSSENFGAIVFPFAVTVDSIVCVLRGSSTPSVTINFAHGTNRDGTGSANLLSSGQAITTTTTGQRFGASSFSDATLAKGEFIWLTTSAQSGTVNELTITMFLRKDAL